MEWNEPSPEESDPLEEYPIEGPVEMPVEEPRSIGEDLIARMAEFNTFGDGMGTFEGEEPQPMEEESFYPELADISPPEDLAPEMLPEDLEPETPMPALKLDREVKNTEYRRLNQDDIRRRQRANLGRMSFYKQKNIDKYGEDIFADVPKPELHDQHVSDMTDATLWDPEVPDEDFPLDAAMPEQEDRDTEWMNDVFNLSEGMSPPSGRGTESPASMPTGSGMFLPDMVWDDIDPPDPRTTEDPIGQTNTNVANAVDAATDSVDQATQDIVNILQAFAANIRRHQYDIRQIKDKLEAEDMRDEY